MSAINGIFYRNGSSISYDLIKKMNNCLSHRGPDGNGIWVEESIALGHQMLHTTPESLQEKLPLHDNHSNLTITADARIDNREELSPLLDLENNMKTTDSLFILKAYQKWGEKCLEKLVGDFAFAIWDVNNKKLFCARDHMGVKPFYYYLSDSVFIFSTEIKALLSLSIINREINEQMVVYHLLSFDQDKEITYYENINRLPNGCYITLIDNKMCLKRYWELNPEKETKFDSDDEYSAVFRHIFFEAVNCRLRSFQNVGSFLSGGLDSSSITCVAENLLKNKKTTLNTFSAVFPSIKESDESEYIQSVLNSGNYHPHFVIADEISPLKDAQRIIWHGDTPNYGPNRFIHYSIYQKAQKNRVRVILDGIDGDTVVSYGFKLLKDLAISLHWVKLSHEVNALSRRTGINRRKIFLEQILIPATPEILKNLFLRDLWYFLKGADKRANNNRIINKELFKRLDLTEIVNSRKNLANYKNEREFHFKTLQNGIHQTVFEGLDHSAASFQIEPRYPFFDKRLVEFCLSLPSEQKLNEGWERVILRRAMHHILPENIQWRKRKSSLGPNFEYNFLNFEDKTIKKMIEDEDIKGYIDLEELKKCYVKYKESKPTDNETLDIMILWNSITLYLWLQSFYNNKKIKTTGDLYE